MAHSADTTYEQNMRGVAAQAAECFERKMLSDSQPKEEIAYAMLTRSLILAKNTATAQRNSLASYTKAGGFLSNPDTSVIDKEIQSALIRQKSKSVSASSSSVPSDAINLNVDIDRDGNQNASNEYNNDPSLLDECIPCLDRTTDVDMMAPLDFLLDGFEFDLEDKWNTLKGIWDILNGYDFYEDVCYLLDFFSFQCLPDLVAILSLLLWLWKSLLQSFQVDINGALWSMIGLMLGPMLTGLESVIQQYIDLIMAPIDCIISSLLFQMSKIPQFEADTEYLFQRQQEQKAFEARVEGTLEDAPGRTIDAATVRINAALDNQLSYAALKATSWDQSKEYYQTQAGRKEQAETGVPSGTITPLTVEDLETVAPKTGGPPGSPEEEARLERLAYIKEREAREKSVATTADWLLDASSNMRAGLGQVGSYLMAGRDRMNSWLESIRDDLRAFLFGSGSSFTYAVSFTETLSRLAFTIGFVKGLIKMAEDGFDCGENREDLTEPDVINFLQNYLAPETGTSVVIGEDGNVTILPVSATPTGISAALPLPSGAVAEAQEGTQTGITLSIPNCLNRTDATDLRKVEEWIKQISQ
jgi:hypothetical protein